MSDYSTFPVILKGREDPCAHRGWTKQPRLAKHDRLLYATLKATNRFAVEVETAPQTKSIKGIRGPKADALKYLKDSYQDFRSVQKTADENKQANDDAWKHWNPFKGRHQAVVLNYNGREWAQETKESAVQFVYQVDRRLGAGPCSEQCRTGTLTTK